MGGWYSFFKTVFVRPAVKWWFRVQIEGTEKLPQGGCLLAGNHLDAGDTFTLPSLIKPKVTFPAKKELFMGKSLKGRVVAWFLTAVGQAPIDRSGGRASVAGLGSVEDVLDAGGVVAIFPEGTRCRDTTLEHMETGCAFIALRAKVPYNESYTRKNDPNKGESDWTFEKYAANSVAWDTSDLKTPPFNSTAVGCRKLASAFTGPAKPSNSAVAPAWRPSSAAKWRVTPASCA